MKDAIDKVASPRRLHDGELPALEIRGLTESSSNKQRHDQGAGMKAFHFLRIAAVITLLYFAGHTAGTPWTPYTDTEAMQVLGAMKSHSFEAEGFKGTYWDLYFGFGVVISVFLLVQAAVLWQVATLAKAEPIRVRPIVGSFLVAFVINTALAWKYFFVVPVVMAGLIALCLALALVLAGRTQATQGGPSSDKLGPKDS